MNKSNQILFVPRSCNKTDKNRDCETSCPCPDSCPEILCHLTGIGMQHRAQPGSLNTRYGAGRESEPMMQRCGCGAGDQTGKGSVPGRALPEHAQKKRSKKRSIDERKHQLEHVQNVIETSGDISCHDGERNAKHRRESPHKKIMGVARV